MNLILKKVLKQQTSIVNEYPGETAALLLQSQNDNSTQSSMEDPKKVVIPFQPKVELNERVKFSEHLQHHQSIVQVADNSIG
jgi:hypothetical protein